MGDVRVGSMICESSWLQQQILQDPKQGSSDASLEIHSPQELCQPAEPGATRRGSRLFASSWRLCGRVDVPVSLDLGYYACPTSLWERGPQSFMQYL
jgi:hypothetical protein